MARMAGSDNEVVLFYPSRSLLAQVMEWTGKHRGFSVRLVRSCGPLSVSVALAESDIVIIDATEHPGPAMDVFRRAAPQMQRGKGAVYTEHLHDGLELFVRLRGVVLLLGPMEQSEWEAFFEPLKNRSAPAFT